MSRKPNFQHPIWEELYHIIEESPGMIDRNTLLFLVKLRSTYQTDRLSADSTIRTSKPEWGDVRRGEKILSSISKFHGESEKEIEKLYRLLCDRDPVSSWARSIIGVGDVFALTIRAYIDISICNYCGRIWRFAGLTEDTPRQKKGEKLKYCKPLKKTVFLIAKSFRMVSNNPRSFYGMAYRSRKALEIARNNKGDFAAQAARELTEKNYSRDTVALEEYSKGRLPPAHLDMRALRWVGKLFLSHWFEVAYRDFHNGENPPMPYVIAIKNHKDLVTADSVLKYESKTLSDSESVKRPKKTKTA